jgi:glycosyltransferase involved in cell wall biosynthesis
VLAFPSRTDTFGLVMIEALACGTPVAGYPVPGPLDVVGADGCGTQGFPHAPVGAVDDDLAAAMVRALHARRGDCAAYGARFSWDRSCDQFLAALAAADPGLPMVA